MTSSSPRHGDSPVFNSHSEAPRRASFPDTSNEIPQMLDIDPDLWTQIRPLVKKGWMPELTSGNKWECGLYALSKAIENAMTSREYSTTLMGYTQERLSKIQRSTDYQVWRDDCAATDAEYQPKFSQTGNFFTDDDLRYMLNFLDKREGTPYSWKLVIIAQVNAGKEQLQAYERRASYSGNKEVVPVILYNHINLHWESIGPVWSEQHPDGDTGAMGTRVYKLVFNDVLPMYFQLSPLCDKSQSTTSLTPATNYAPHPIEHITRKRQSSPPVHDSPKSTRPNYSHGMGAGCWVGKAPISLDGPLDDYTGLDDKAIAGYLGLNSTGELWQCIGNAVIAEGVLAWKEFGGKIRLKTLLDFMNTVPKKPTAVILGAMKISQSIGIAVKAFRSTSKGAEQLKRLGASILWHVVQVSNSGTTFKVDKDVISRLCDDLQKKEKKNKGRNEARFGVPANMGEETRMPRLGPYRELGEREIEKWNRALTLVKTLAIRCNRQCLISRSCMLITDCDVRSLSNSVEWDDVPIWMRSTFDFLAPTECNGGRQVIDLVIDPDSLEDTELDSTQPIDSPVQASGVGEWTLRKHIRHICDPTSAPDVVTPESICRDTLRRQSWHRGLDNSSATFLHDVVHTAVDALGLDVVSETAWGDELRECGLEAPDEGQHPWPTIAQEQSMHSTANLARLTEFHGPSISDAILILDAKYHSSFRGSPTISLWSIGVLPELDEDTLLLDHQLVALTWLLLQHYGNIPKVLLHRADVHMNEKVTAAANRMAIFRVNAGILSDGMGMGKTRSICAFLAVCSRCQQEDLTTKPSIVVTPANGLPRTWARDVHLFLPYIRPILWHGTIEADEGGTFTSLLGARDVHNQKMTKAGYEACTNTTENLAYKNVIITSYQTLVARSLVSRPVGPAITGGTARAIHRYSTIRNIFGTMVFDEAHVIRRDNTYQDAVRLMEADAVYLVTGTPIINGEKDILGALKVMWPSIKATFTHLDEYKHQIAVGGTADEVDYLTIAKMGQMSWEKNKAADPHAMQSLLKEAKTMADFGSKYGVMEKLLLLRRSVQSNLRVDDGHTRSMKDVFPATVCVTRSIELRESERKETHKNHLDACTEYEAAKRTKGKYFGTSPLRKMAIAADSSIQARFAHVLEGASRDIDVPYSDTVLFIRRLREKHFNAYQLVAATRKEADGPIRDLFDMAAFLLQGAPKAREVIKEILRHCFSEDKKLIRKLLVVLEIPSCAWFLETVLRMLYIPVATMHASMNEKARTALQAAFNSPDTFDPAVLLLMYNVGGVGINLDKSCHKVILCSSAGNMAIERQAYHRIIRLTQAYTVQVIKLHVPETHDDFKQQKKIEKDVVGVMAACKEDRHFTAIADFLNAALRKVCRERETPMGRSILAGNAYLSETDARRIAGNRMLYGIATDSFTEKCGNTTTLEVTSRADDRRLDQGTDTWESFHSMVNDQVVKRMGLHGRVWINQEFYNLCWLCMLNTRANWTGQSIKRNWTGIPTQFAIRRILGASQGLPRVWMYWVPNVPFAGSLIKNEDEPTAARSDGQHDDDDDDDTDRGSWNREIMGLYTAPPPSESVVEQPADDDMQIANTDVVSPIDQARSLTVVGLAGEQLYNLLGGKEFSREVERAVEGRHVQQRKRDNDAGIQVYYGDDPSLQLGDNYYQEERTEWTETEVERVDRNGTVRDRGFDEESESESDYGDE